MKTRGDIVEIVKRIKQQLDGPSLDGRGYLGSLTIKKTEAIAGGGVAIEGLASTPAPDRTDDVIQPAAFAIWLERYLQDNPAFLWQHDYDEPLGTCVDAKILPEGLWVRDEVFGETEVQAKAVKLIKQRTLRALSVGGIVHTAAWHQEGENPWAWREITEMEIVEHSAVTIPCNRRTLFAMAKSLGASRTALLELAAGDLRLGIASTVEGARAELAAIRELAKGGRTMSAANRSQLASARNEARKAAQECDAAKALLLGAVDDLQDLLDPPAPEGAGEEELTAEEAVALTAAFTRLGERVLGR